MSVIKKVIETETGDRLVEIDGRWFRGPGDQPDASKVREVTPKTALLFSKLANPDLIHPNKTRSKEKVAELSQIGNNEADFVLQERGRDIDDDDDDDEDDYEDDEDEEEEEDDGDEDVVKAAMRLLENSKKEAPPPPPRSPKEHDKGVRKGGVHTPVVNRPKSLGNLLSSAPQLSSILNQKDGDDDEEEEDDEYEDEDEEEDREAEEDGEAEDEDEDEDEDREDAKPAGKRVATSYPHKHKEKSPPPASRKAEKKADVQPSLGRILSQNSKSKQIIRDQLMNDARSGSEAESEAESESVGSDSAGSATDDEEGLVRTLKKGRPRTKHDHPEAEERRLLQNMPKKASPSRSSRTSSSRSHLSSISSSSSSRRKSEKKSKRREDEDEDDDDLTELISAAMMRAKKSSTPASSRSSSSSRVGSATRGRKSTSPRAERLRRQMERKEEIRRKRMEMKRKKGALSEDLVNMGLQPWQQLMDPASTRGGDEDAYAHVGTLEDAEYYSTDDLFEEGELPDPVSDTDSDNDTPELRRDRRRRRRRRNQLKLSRHRKIEREKRAKRRKEHERLQIIQYKQVLDELRISNPHVPQYDDEDVDLDTVRYAVQKYSGHRAMNDKLSQFKNGIALAANVIEFVASKTKGLVQLKGFTRRLQDQMDLPANQNALAQLSRKYMKFGSIPPEIILGTMILMTAREVHVANSSDTPLPPVGKQEPHQPHEPQHEDGEMSGFGGVIGSAMKFMQNTDSDSKGGGGAAGSGGGGMFGGMMNAVLSAVSGGGGSKGGGGGGIGSDSSKFAPPPAPPPPQPQPSSTQAASGSTNSERIVASILDDDDDV